MLRFEFPWALLLLILPVLLLLRRQRPSAISFSRLAHLRPATRTWRVRLARLPDACLLLGWCALVLALARPQAGMERMLDSTEGIAIEMVLDRSSSMSQDMASGGGANRFETAKRAFQDFVYGDGHDLGGRPNDLVGFIAFARYADTICPLTLSHDTMRPLVEATELVSTENEDGTAIGDALALAAARLQKAEETLAAQAKKDPDAFHLASKIIILLTDGENNCGKRTIAQAADLAREWGIKVYAIAIDSREHGLIGRLLSRPLDTSELQRLADVTGGLCRLASDRKSLLQIYEEIDQLERSRIETLRFIDYRELFAPFAGTALALLVLGLVLHSTLFRRLP